jgi:very-short-patch-repair endonuclease
VENPPGGGRFGHAGAVEVDDALSRWGGLATRAQLMRVCGRAAVDRALASGALVAVARGRYTGRWTHTDLARAHALTGVLSHESAALHHGWEVLHVPEQAHVIVPAKRRVSRENRRGVVLHYADLHVDEISGTVTNRERTLVDCLRSLPLSSALAVADSALRAGDDPAWLVKVAAGVRGPGAKQARFVARHASELAANPFESGLRAISLGVPDLNMRPQVDLQADGRFLGRPDLVDLELGIVAEADSFEWHGGRSALVRDARRYNGFVVDGWMVLRFTWEDVMWHPDAVEKVLRAAVDRQEKMRSGRRSRRQRPPSPV